MFGRGRFFRGGVRGGRGMAGGRGGAQRWNAANTTKAAPMQVLSKAQKNKERYVEKKTFEIDATFYVRVK